MNDAAGVVCVLHGSPPVPSWLTETAEVLPVVLVVNDPAPGRYGELPAAATVLVNEEPAGFAENVDRAVEELFRQHDVDVVLAVNFDLALDREVLHELCAVLRGAPRLAAVGPVLTGLDGHPVFSAGRLPRPTVEFLRAAGLRQGRLLDWQRRLLRRSSRWRGRNAVADQETVRQIPDGQYLPWTCVAVRRSAWVAVGPLDRRYRLYAEDIDWSVRALADGWGLGLVSTTSPVVHTERWTQSPLTDAWFEASHAVLHTVYGWRSCRRAQRAGLWLRRCSPMRWVSPLVWSEVDR